MMSFAFSRAKRIPSSTVSDCVDGDNSGSGSSGPARWPGESCDKAHLPKHFLIVSQLDDKRDLAKQSSRERWSDCVALRETHLERILQPLGEVERNQVAEVERLRRRPLCRARGRDAT